MVENKTAPKTLATITIDFHEDGDATYSFGVSKGITHPSMQDLGVIAFAKICSGLVGGLMASESLPDINKFVTRVIENRELGEEDE